MWFATSVPIAGGCQGGGASKSGPELPRKLIISGLIIESSNSEMAVEYASARELALVINPKCTCTNPSSRSTAKRLKNINRRKPAVGRAMPNDAFSGINISSQLNCDSDFG